MSWTWARIQEYPNYEVNEQGDIRNSQTKRKITPRTNAQGYLMVNIMDDFNKRQVTRSVAPLVAKAFLDPPESDIYNSIIHLDGDRQNCHVSNLMWKPRWYSIQYHKQFGKREYDISVYCADTDEVFTTLREAAMTYGLLENRLYLGVVNREPVWPLNYLFLEYIE